jgi:hypothetical protein
MLILKNGGLQQVMKKRVISILLAVVMIAAVIPAVVFADEQAASRTKISETGVHVIGVGSMETQADVNIYEFVLEKAGRVSIKFEHEGIEESDGYRYWWVQLIGEDGTVYLNYDVFGHETESTSINNYIDAGVYFVQIQRPVVRVIGNIWGAWGSLATVRDSTIDYSVTVNYTENIGQFEIEINDDAESANPITLGKPITGNLFNTADVDIFTFTLDKADNITLNFKHANIDSTNDYWWIRLLNESGTALLDFQSAGNVTDLTSPIINLPAGTYLVRIEQGHWGFGIHRRHRSDDYTLTVSIANPGFKIGHVRGNPAIGIDDALEILKYLAGLPGEISPGNDAFNAARIVTPGEGNPSISDVLEILKHLAGLPNLIDDVS